ncbi:MAG: hypothetical protein RR207_05990 [Clostridia bacterium]
MKNKIIEKVVDEFINDINESQEFKNMFKAYIDNKFAKNSGKNDLVNLLAQLKIEEDDLL